MSKVEMNPVINPIHWSAQNLVSYGPDTIHELALKAAGTLHSYHVVLGRCLLAVQRTKLYELFGCSGAVHYGTQVLGLRAQKARALRWVAEKLESLPRLSRAGELGEVAWSKLREVVRKATPETEEFWLELCRRKNYREVEKLVRCTPNGAIPGDLPTEGEKEPRLCDLRLHLGPTARAVVDRGLQVYSLEQGRPVPLAEAVEALFAKLVQKEDSSVADLEALSKSQEEARKDLMADQYRRLPLVQEARKLAWTMGLAACDEASRSLGDSSDADPPLEHLASELLETMEIMTLENTPQECSARDSPEVEQIAETPKLEISSRENHETEFPVRDISGVDQLAETPNPELLSRKNPEPEFPVRDISESERPARETPGDHKRERNANQSALWDETLAAHQVACPGDKNVILLANDWRNRRLRFNEDARLPTPAQRREILRREGYCCSTPGCSNHLWLEVHHIVFYSRKGKTIPANTTAICGSCHRNVHRGHLRISGQAPDKLVFRDRHGNDLRRTHELGVAGWLDYWCGWSGGPENSHKHRAAEATTPHSDPRTPISRAGNSYT